VDLIQMLRRCEVLVGLDDSDLQKIADLPSWHRSTYEQGEHVFNDNDKATHFYILEEGEIRLIATLHNERAHETTEVPVDTITKGDVFGWSSLVPPYSLTMTAVCTKQSTVLAVAGTELISLMDGNQALGYEVMKGLVRIISARLRDLLAWI
jgi:CRP/FNR family cyclic AMP-dependent transcriptional regulator